MPKWAAQRRSHAATRHTDGRLTPTLNLGLGPGSGLRGDNVSTGALPRARPDPRADCTPAVVRPSCDFF
eukprot:606294-Prymnesium_polylepis.1